MRLNLGEGRFSERLVDRVVVVVFDGLQGLLQSFVFFVKARIGHGNDVRTPIGLGRDDCFGGRFD